MSKKKMTVLLSSYNGEKYIREQIESIMKQQGDFILKLLIRDDGSSDNTKLIIKEMMKKYSNIEMLEGKNVGVNASFFQLINIALSSDYYAISDQDDVWFPQKLKIAYDALEKDKTKMLYGSADIYVDKDLKYITDSPIVKRNITKYNVMIQNFIGGHTQVFTKEFAEIIKKNFDLKKIYAYDAYFTNVAVLHNALIFDERAYVYYRLHDKNLVSTGIDFFDWIKKNIKRIYRGEGHKYSVQFDYIYKTYSYLLNSEDNKNFEDFIKSKKFFLKRLVYIFNMPFYRQDKKETLVFKLLYLFGGWK